MKKKVLIICEKYSPNLGDSVIADIVEKLFADKYDTKTLDLSGRNEIDILESFNLKNNFKNKVKKNIKKYIKKIGFFIYGENLKKNFLDFKSNFLNLVDLYNPDYILFAGGQLIMDSFYNQILFVLDYSERNRISVVFNACGASNINSIFDRKKLKKIFSFTCIKYFSVRDHFNDLKKYDKNNILYDTYDTAIVCNKLNFKSTTSDTYGIGIMIDNNIDYNIQFLFWKKIIKLFEKLNYKYEIFCNGSADDYNFILKLQKELNISPSKIAKQPHNSSELILIINQYSKLLTMRLHSIIIAFSYNIPSVAISWNKKIDEFYKKIDCSKYCLSFSTPVENIMNSFINCNKKNFFIDDTKLNIENEIFDNINNIYKIFS